MSRFRIAVPTVDCYAVAVGGTEYRAKDGFIDVDNSSHAKAIMREVGSKSVVATTGQGTGKFCGFCAFHAYDFTKTCPRCKGTKWQ